MDEEKKSEAKGEDPERLEPYLLQEQVEQSHDSPVEMYLATHETSGAKALVRKHTAEEKAAQRPEWLVRIGYLASQGYSMLHMEHTGFARALDKQTAESLLFTLERVLEEVRRMASVLAVTPEPRPRWHLGLGVGVVSAAAVGALLFALVHVDPVSQPPSTPPAPISHAELSEAEALDSIEKWLADAAPEEPFSLARPLPKAPYKGQKRPPCRPPVEVELVGGCWGTHEMKPPCRDSLHEHEGKCYVPFFSAKPAPSSLGQ
ncbi:hypothetical protein [Archangium sp.]|uniref:hypothetical protein n=1 Tax=Archangium sp. TaxID=1872627 RepID=UPI00286BC7EB|nr:hypothetical protein [Archangium sp.]